MNERTGRVRWAKALLLVAEAAAEPGLPLGEQAGRAPVVAVRASQRGVAQGRIPERAVV